MHYVYLLKSEVDNELYIGSTSDLKRRFAEHNSGQSRATKPRRPFQLVYYEAYKSRADAIFREKNLKRYSRAYQELKKRIAGSI
ncbi:MAG: GIY-YIG nuclease family protein [Patescibacteria group bacterium]